MFFKLETTSDALIQAFIKSHYPDLKLNAKMFEQLSWLHSNSTSTSQSNVGLKSDPVNIEVKRILSRLNSFKIC